MNRQPSAPSPRRTRRRLAAAALAVVALAGFGLASAATLGVRGGTLQAGSAVVGDCQGDTAVNVSFRSTFQNGAYSSDQVTVSGLLPACVGQYYEITIVGTGASLPLTISSQQVAGATIQRTFTARPAANIQSVAIVIHS